MPVIKFIMNVVKKLGRLFGGSGSDSQMEEDRLPGERRIGIYGPSSVGKSVFFTMLYKASSKKGKGQDFLLSPRGMDTAEDLNSQLNTLNDGNWLPGTVRESELDFWATLRGGSQFPFSSRDYKGESVDLEEKGQAKENLIKYFQGCDAILFLISPEMIADERKCAREIMNFNSMIGLVTDEGGRGLRIPVGLMITKADEIPGFEAESQVTLVSRRSEYLKAKDFEEFVEGVCEQMHIKRNIAFQEQVHGVLGRLRLFFEYMLTLSMEFQVFFVSSVGHVRKVEESDGTVASYPPLNPTGIGVKTPFLWVIDTIRRRERIARFNGIRRFVFSIAVVVLLVYSLFYAMAFLRNRPPLEDLIAPESDVAAAEVEKTLEGQSEGFPLAVVRALPVPAGRPGTLVNNRKKLLARYQAYRFLEEELYLAQNADDVAALSEGWEETRRSNGWYTRLSPEVTDDVDDAVLAHIESFNRKQLEEILTYDPTGRDQAEIREYCKERLDRMVEPFDGVAEFAELRTTAEYARDLKLADLNEAQALAAWRDLELEYDHVSERATTVRGDKVQTYVDGLRAWVEENQDRQNRTIGDKVGEANRRLSKLDAMLDAMDLLADGDDSQSLRELRPLTRAGNPPLVRDWARYEIDRIQAGQNQERLADLVDDYSAQFGDPSSVRWLFDEHMHRKLLDLPLSGTKRAARDLFFENLESMRQDGIALQLQVVSVPDGYVVVYRDQRPGEQRWAQSQAKQNMMLPVYWLPDQDFEIGLLKDDAGEAESPKGYAANLFDLHETDVQIVVPGFGGTPTQVRFTDLPQKVNPLLRDVLTPLFND